MFRSKETRTVSNSLQYAIYSMSTALPKGPPLALSDIPRAMIGFLTGFFWHCHTVTVAPAIRLVTHASQSSSRQANSQSKFVNHNREISYSHFVVSTDFVPSSYIHNPAVPYITIATPIAPPNTPTASHPQHLDLGANPVCRPGEPRVVPLGGPTPAVPLGVTTPLSVACITVTAVIVDWTPLPSVVVCSIKLVCDLGDAGVGALVTVFEVTGGALVAAAPDWPERVITPPSMVVTIVTPAALVVVTTAPGVRVLANIEPTESVTEMTAPGVRDTALA